MPGRRGLLAPEGKMAVAAVPAGISAVGWSVPIVPIQAVTITCSNS